jgi:sulfate permease, SulP family
MLTLLGVIILDVLPGLVIGVTASILLLVYRASRPPLSVMGADPAGPGAYLDIRRHPQARPIPGVLIVRPDVPLFYANAQSVRDRLTDLVGRAGPPVHTLILDLDANDEFDITTAEVLEKLVGELNSRQVRVGLAHVHAPAAQMLQQSGAMATIGDDRIFPNLAAAVAWASTPEAEGSRTAGGPADAKEN